MFGYRLIKSRVFCLLLFFSHSTLAQKEPFKQKLKSTVWESGISSQNLGLIVADSKNIFYKLNADQQFIPASLTKIVTAAVLLDSLSPSLKFKTHFMAKTKVVNARLRGNLYLKGGGDPAFVSESLWNLVNNLKRTGLKKIQGDLILDATRFDPQKRGLRLRKISHKSYDAPIGALSFNWNTANIYVRPGKKLNQPLRVVLDPSASYFTSVKNRSQTVRARKRRPIIIKRHKQKEKRESLSLTGTLSLKHPEILLYKNILYPSQWTGWNTVEFLKQRGITVEGQIKEGKVPRGAQILAEWQGRPLRELIQLMMKFSNNFMAEMLIKNMVVELTGHRGELKEGITILRKYLTEKQNISAKEYQLVQVSGLSRKNKLKASQLLKILRYWTSHPLQAEFESALALAGEDGTLKKYFFNSHLQANIHAKTGTLKGVTGLAGYLRTKKGKKRIFVFIFNGQMSSQKKAEKLFRQLAYIIWKH